MRHRDRRRRPPATILIALLLSALVGASALHAAQPAPSDVSVAVDTSRWRCSLCLNREGWYGTLDFGLGHVSDSSLKYADYRGLDEQGAFPAVDGDMHYRDSRDRYFDVFARDLGVDNRSLDMRGGWRGRYQLRLAYRDIPKYRGFGTATVYSGVGSGSLTLPTDWQKSFTTAGMTTLDSSLTPVSLKTLRRTLAGGLTLKFARKWTFDTDLQHETKEGSHPFGAGLLTINASQFPVPVDFTTDRFDMGLQYSGERAHLRLGFAGSWFDNGVAAVTWENPFNSAPDTQLLRAALEPGNEFYQFSLQGAFAPRPGLRLSGRAALGRMRQDDPFLPFSINPQFNDLTLPRAAADSRLDTGTLNVAGKLAARLASRLDLSASVKIDQRDNNSPVDVYTIVTSDFVRGGDRLNRPYSFESGKYDLELDYRATPVVNLRAGAWQEQYDRSLQSVLQTDERLYWGELNLSPWSVAQLRVKLETSERDASPFQQVDVTGLIENPLLRKFHFADRDRDRAVVEVDLATSQPWSLNVSWSQAQDDYTSNALGLQESDEQNFGVDFGVSLGPRISLNAYASRDDITSALSGFDAAAQSPWQAFTDDRITTLGMNISGRMSKRVTLGLDWVESTSRGRIAVIAGTAHQPFPVLRSRLGNVRGYITFALSRNWAWKLAAEHENLSTSDWQVDDLGAAGIANVLTLGDISPRYSITALRVQASYRF
jgi:MtrB/PioB family decaheme-associated outer membrane protein